MTKQEFHTLTEKNLLLDGATGTNLIKAGMPRGACTEKWVLEHPEVLIDLQKQYIAAGSQIVYAPTFGGNRTNLTKHGLADQLEEINTTLVGLSKQAAAGSDVLIAGDITTTGELMEPFGDLTYEEAFEIYCEQISYLVKAGVDLIVAETMLSIDETVAAIDAAHHVCDLPVMCSVTCQPDGKLFFGGDAVSAAIAFEKAGADAVGLNCSAGPAELVSVVADIKKAVKVPVIAKLNAGAPDVDANGVATYHIQPSEFTDGMKKVIDSGATILGGCCGTTPEFIEQLKELL